MWPETEAGFAITLGPGWDPKEDLRLRALAEIRNPRWPICVYTEMGPRHGTPRSIHIRRLTQRKAVRVLAHESVHIALAKARQSKACDALDRDWCLHRLEGVAW